MSMWLVNFRGRPRCSGIRSHGQCCCSYSSISLLPSSSLQ